MEQNLNPKFMECPQSLCIICNDTKIGLKVYAIKRWAIFIKEQQTMLKA
jgi:hypothetical protein